MKEEVTPLEKALELVEAFYGINDSKKENLGTNPYISREYAVECSIKSVEYIILNVSKVVDPYFMNGFRDFWIAVIEELQKMRKN